MKVLFVLGFLNPFPGAAWTRVEFFAEYFIRRGHEVDVAGVFSAKNIRKAGLKYWKGMKIFNICPTFWLGLSSISSFLNVCSSIITLIPFLQILRPNISIISVPSGDQAIGAYLASRLVKANVIIDYRDEWEDYLIRAANSKVAKFFFSVVKKLLTIFYMKTQLVTAVTPNFVDSLKQRGISNVRFVPNGADIAVFKQYNKNIVRQKLGFNSSDFVIVYNGLIGCYYKFDNVLLALKKLVRQIKNVKLLLIGDGPDVSKILLKSKTLGIAGNVLYIGIKDDKKEIAEILSASDVGLIPGLYTEGQLPVKLFEYGACGLPIVATVSLDSLLSKLIKKYKIGVIVPSMNEEKIAKAIYRIYKNEYFRATAGKRARLLVEENFDRNKIADLYTTLVEGLLYGNK